MLIMSVIISLSAFSQAIYPVQVYTQLTPPYTPYVPAYYTGTQEKLSVTLVNTDMHQPLLNVYLKMKITSSSFSLITPDEVFTPHIELQAGVPLKLSLTDLAVYFKKENLRVSGGQNEFYRTQLLPDNFYRFNFEVYEVNTNKLLSNPKMGFAQTMIASGEPPVLTMPQKGEIVIEKNIPNIFFSWVPRHMNSIAAAYGTEYEFTMVEIYDKRVAPEAAFDYARVLYTETTKSTTFVHTAAQPMLQPGLRYAWRVRAVTKEGVNEISVFKNGGYSLVYWFDYTKDCKPVYSTGAIYDRDHIKITWIETKASDYTVEYRKKGSSKWYTGNITGNHCSIYNLKLGGEYEYRVGSRCLMNDPYQYSEIKGFRLPAQEERSPNCGLMPDTKLTNRVPARELQKGLPVIVGDFPVFITKVSGSGRFSGEGYVGIPYLQGAQITVTFKDIVVNTDNQLISGYFETKYDTKTNNRLVDIDQTLTGGKGVGDIRTGEEKAAFKVDYTINPHIKAKVTIQDDGQDDISEEDDYTTLKGINESYKGHIVIEITDDKGKKQKIVADKIPATIEDAGGKIYEIDEVGNITLISQISDIKLDDKTKNKQRSDIATLSFRASTNTKYSIDEYKDIYAKVTEYYEKYKFEGTNIEASAKFMLPGTSDEVEVYIKDSKKQFVPDSVRFINSSGKEYTSKYNQESRTWLLTTVGSEANDGQELFAVQRLADGSVATLGKLNIFTYQPLERTLNLVSVNGASNHLTAQSVQEELNKIYGKIGITWKVNFLQSGFTYTPANRSTFNVTGSGLFSTLTNDMKAINEAFKKTNIYQEDGLYLFVLPYEPSDKGESMNASGDMPLGSQFGYLFPSADARTIAHEIGHGAFNLEHPFSRPGRNSFKKGDLQNNLMDYTSGTDFAKIQWDATRAPGLVIGLLQDDNSGLWTAISLDYLKPYLQDDTYTFITPAGNYIPLPAHKLKEVLFSTLDNTFLIGTDKQTNVQPPLGSLVGFITSDNKFYSAIYKNKVFEGYYTKDDEKYVILKNENISKLTDRGIAVFLGIENEQIVNYIGLFKSSNPQAKINTDGLGAGELLDKPFIINIPETNRNKIDFYSFLNQVGEKTNKIYNPKYELKNGEKIINLLNLKEPKGGNYTVESLLKKLINEKCTVEEYLYFFSLINQFQQIQQENSSQELDKLLDCISNITIQDIKDSYQLISVEVKPEGSDHTINSIRTLGRTGYDILKSKAYNSNKIYNELNNIYFDRKTNKSSAYYNLLEKNLKNEVDFNCSLAGLDIYVRIDVIDYLIKGHYFTIDESPIIYHLINTTPDNDVLTLLNEGVKADNYKWLKLIKDHGNSTEINTLYSEINRLVIDNYASLNVQPTLTTKTTTVFDADGNEKELSFSYPLGFYQRTFVGLKNEYTEYDQYLLSLCSNSYSATKSTITDDGKINFDGCYVWDYQSVIKAPGSVTTKVQQPHLTLDPFEPMELVVIGNFGAVDIPPYKMDNGTVITTTSMMGMLIAEGIGEYQSDQNLRKIFDGLTIGGALIAVPFTGGTSLSAIVADLAVIAGVSSTIDLVVASQEENLTSEEYANNKEVLDAWNTFHTTVMTADAVGGGAALGKTSYQAIRAIESWDNFLSLSKANVRYLKGNAKELWWTVKYRCKSFGKVVSKEELLKYPPFVNGQNLEFADETLRLYSRASKSEKLEDWLDLSDFFRKNKLNEYKGAYFPPMDGGYNIREISLKKGMIFDRYQKEVSIMKGERPELKGGYVSPVKGTPFSFSSRSLFGVEDDYALFYQIEILQDLPIKGEVADVIPWFGYSGRGKQISLKFDNKYKNLESLIDDGYIRITIKKSPNKEYEKYINLIIEDISE